MDRLDKILVIRNLVETRTKAQELIASGAVAVNSQVQTKASFYMQRIGSFEIGIEKKPICVIINIYDYWSERLYEQRKIS